MGPGVMVSGAKAEAFNGRYTRRDTNNPDLTRRLRGDYLYARQHQILKAYPWYEKDDGSGNYIHYSSNGCWYIRDYSKSWRQYCGGEMGNGGDNLALPDP